MIVPTVGNIEWLFLQMADVLCFAIALSKAQRHKVYRSVFQEF